MKFILKQYASHQCSVNFLTSGSAVEPPDRELQNCMKISLKTINKYILQLLKRTLLPHFFCKICHQEAYESSQRDVPRQDSMQLCPLFLTMKFAALHLISIKSYSRNTHVRFISKQVIDYKNFYIRSTISSRTF